MIYVDTSALVPMFVREAKTDAVLAWLEALPGPIAVSDWGLVEFASAVTLKVRAGSITAALAREAITQARSFAEEHCTLACPRREEFRRAAQLAADPASGLRAGDALHVAMAEGLDAKAMLCLDAAMARSAKALGLESIVP